MVALTYGDTRVAGADAKKATKDAPRQTWLARFLTAMQESRMRQAQREIRLYAPQLHRALEAQGELPFSPANDTPRGGW